MKEEIKNKREKSYPSSFRESRAGMSLSLYVTKRLGTHQDRYGSCANQGASGLTSLGIPGPEDEIVRIGEGHGRHFDAGAVVPLADGAHVQLGHRSYSAIAAHGLYESKQR